MTFTIRRSDRCSVCVDGLLEYVGSAQVVVCHAVGKGASSRPVKIRYYECAACGNCTCTDGSFDVHLGHSSDGDPLSHVHSFPDNDDLGSAIWN